MALHHSQIMSATVGCLVWVEVSNSFLPANLEHLTLTLWHPLLPCGWGAAIKHPVTDWVKPSFVIFDIRALWCPGLSVRAPGCQSTNEGLPRSVTWCFIAAPHPYGNIGHQTLPCSYIDLHWCLRWELSDIVSALCTNPDTDSWTGNADTRPRQGRHELHRHQSQSSPPVHSVYRAICVSSFTELLNYCVSVSDSRKCCYRLQCICVKVLMSSSQSIREG